MYLCYFFSPFILISNLLHFKLFLKHIFEIYSVMHYRFFPSIYKTNSQISEARSLVEFIFKIIVPSINKKGKKKQCFT
uniref:Uncharacterized protein n=1 Tax=Pseudonaja textilis TaxID=8673 RepID=A0A670YT33_PSETE